jgi:hypothetical protein
MPAACHPAGLGACCLSLLLLALVAPSHADEYSHRCGQRGGSAPPTRARQLRFTLPRCIAVCSAPTPAQLRARARASSVLRACAAAPPHARAAHCCRYAIGDAVRLWVNKVGPYNNPTETYNYYELPFCKPAPEAPPVHKWGGLGEVLGGNELIDSTLAVAFRVDAPSTAVCTQTLSADDVRAFARAVTRHYWCVPICASLCRRSRRAAALARLL